MTTAYIGLGSNQGVRLINLAEAIESISRMPNTHVMRVSNAYETEPAYLADQPPFANAAIEIETSLEADQLLGCLQEIETEMGRERTVPNGPRVIDLDILTFGDEEMVSDTLTIPHPGLRERDFVVTPLLEIAPRLHLPDGARVMHDGATVGRVVDELGPIPDLGRLVNDPLLAGEWVEVAHSAREQDLVAGWDAHLQFRREVLDEAGIPFAWDPYEPESSMDPFGMGATFRLLVPAVDAERALRLFADIDAAEPILPPELLGDMEV